MICYLEMSFSLFKVVLLLIFAALTCVPSSFASGALYEQHQATESTSSGHGVCMTGKEQLKASSQIECTLKCRLRQKNALVGGSHSDECICYTRISSILDCEKENEMENLEGENFIKIHVSIHSFLCCSSERLHVS